MFSPQSDHAASFTQNENTHITGLLAAMDDDTDFVITAASGKYRWRVHADVLKQHSDFFKTMIEGSWKETKKQCVDLPDDNPWIIARMLQFFYRGEFDYEHQPSNKSLYASNVFGSATSQVKPGPGSKLTLLKLMRQVKPDLDPVEHIAIGEDKKTDSHLSQLEINMAIYTIADKYGVKGLRNVALQKFKLQMPSHQSLMDMCGGDFRALIDKDQELKLAVASRIAASYEHFRKHESTWLEDLFESDLQLCMLVMDSMKGMGPPLYSMNVPNSTASTSSARGATKGFSFGSVTPRSVAVTPMPPQSAAFSRTFESSNTSTTSTVVPTPSFGGLPSSASSQYFGTSSGSAMGFPSSGIATPTVPQSSLFGPSLTREVPPRFHFGS